LDKNFFINKENPNHITDTSEVKRAYARGRIVIAPWGHVDTTIDDNIQCPVCDQYSMAPIFVQRGNERDYGQPASHAVVPTVINDGPDDLLDPVNYRRGPLGNVQGATQDARTIMECLNTRCPNRDSGKRYTQRRTVQEVILR
jgi:hypothetical protein